MPTTFNYDTSGNWYKGNVHLHTTRSDGHLSVGKVAQLYKRDGYDFLCVTDHQKIFHSNGNGSSFPLVMLKGIELDGHDDQGTYYHVLAIGAAKKHIERAAFMEAVQAARSEGAILIWAHPHWTGNSLEEGLRHVFHGMEIYNHSSQCEIGKGYASLFWDSALEVQPNFLGFAVDDSHFNPSRSFWKGGWVMVNAPHCTEAAILRSLSRGNFYSSQGPRFESIRQAKNKIILKTSPIKCVRLIGPRSNGKWIYPEDNATDFEFQLSSDWAYTRLEIEDAHGKLAWSNPLFI